jgi:glycosyltransferase involved in cell wall biosynthesis
VLPQSVIGIQRTESVEELALYYSLASVFVNPTYQDNFPTTNIEALACGTPVITYNTGGSPEAIDKETGEVVPKGNKKALQEAIIKWCTAENKVEVQKKCRERAIQFFNKDDRYAEYVHLYEKISKKDYVFK